jgi:hypothetical protein
MPINRLLKEGKFTPEEVDRLNRAFALALNLLGLVDRNYPICETVAREIIEIDADGTHEPDEIAKLVLAAWPLAFFPPSFVAALAGWSCPSGCPKSFSPMSASHRIGCKQSRRAALARPPYNPNQYSLCPPPREAPLVSRLKPSMRNVAR